MRTGKMKNVLKKIGAFTLAFIMAVPMTGGWTDTVRAETSFKTITSIDKFEIVAEQNGNVIDDADADNLPSLEKGDELTLRIKDICADSYKKVIRFTGSLVFTDEKGNNIGECFEDIHEKDYGSDLGSIELNKAGRYHEFQLTSDTGVDIEENNEILWINLRVKRAVNKDVRIIFQGADPDKDYGFEMTRLPLATQGTRYYRPIEKTITNKWYGERKLSFTVAGNSERTDDTAIDVPVKNTKTKKTRVAVRINKDNGTDKGTDKLGYNGFTLSYTYNTKYLSLDRDKSGKEIYYELSDNAKKYKEKDKKDITTTDFSDDKGERRTITVTFLSQSGEDIDVYGDFLYLTFVPADNSQQLGLANVDANVDVTLKGGVNSAATEMKTEVRDGQSYLDANKDVCGGTRTFRVNFVKTLIRFGDVNNDTYVNLIDAVLILQHYNGIRKLTADEMERANADDSVDSDGNPTIDLKDVLFIMRYANGEITELPVDIS